MAIIKKSVTPWSISTRVKVDDSGSEESIIYLLPITANKAPTLSPNLESIPSECIKKQIKEIRNAIYIPRNIFQNKPPASRVIDKRTRNELYSDLSAVAVSSPNAVSYTFVPVLIIQLSILQPLSVNRES